MDHGRCELPSDSSRIPLAPETATRSEKLWSLEPKPKDSEDENGTVGRVTGTSHAGEVAAVSIASGILSSTAGANGRFQARGKMRSCRAKEDDSLVVRWRRIRTSRWSLQWRHLQLSNSIPVSDVGAS